MDFLHYRSAMDKVCRMFIEEADQNINFRYQESLAELIDSEPSNVMNIRDALRDSGKQSSNYVERT